MDFELRRLEREATSGDPAAVARLKAMRDRRDPCPKCGKVGREAEDADGRTLDKVHVQVKYVGSVEWLPCCCVPCWTAAADVKGQNRVVEDFSGTTHAPCVGCPTFPWAAFGMSQEPPHEFPGQACPRCKGTALALRKDGKRFCIPCRREVRAHPLAQADPPKSTGSDRG